MTFTQADPLAGCLEAIGAKELWRKVLMETAYGPTCLLIACQKDDRRFFLMRQGGPTAPVHVLLDAGIYRHALPALEAYLRHDDAVIDGEKPKAVPPELRPVMRCGHVADTFPPLGDPYCALCHGHGLPHAKNITEYPAALAGRVAKCSRCGTQSESRPDLPYFVFTPRSENDLWYCGCGGWD